jgi:hypothetical protein
MAKEFEDYARECQQMEIGTKPIPISVVTAVTNSALNAASVFPSRRIEISDSHTDLNLQMARSIDWSAIPCSSSASSTSNARLALQGGLRRRAPANSIMPGVPETPPFALPHKLGRGSRFRE